MLNENNKDDVLNLFDKKDMAQCHSYPMFKIYDFLQSLQKVFADYAIGGSRKFLNEGVPCELLKLGASKWRKGKVKLN
ncbi:KGK domain-containing protein [Microcoleus sp. FACHB-672]|uniref:KGK domain-containing protein n=1 Tax=Microcoleus sp. FACHB-672 TaxID=2692825 RepID=UPI00168A306D|nr:KGK domain-containing protein [Microcoleus sp. FACHB-672]MBD2039598.1 hypothetical protein [Microcoleus sp. FACHB-672]